MFPTKSRNSPFEYQKSLQKSENLRAKSENTGEKTAERG
jgi:hypothetical protein